ncbi:guanylate cyclase soluble subunit beta-1-like [Dermacentor silvarum]|uniref:guanylate cyclase soluble subunit beta-1-like n=1 Tax=Dermacentor silvarum TaxID=543639 RepID=UPI00210181A6|nr:guanylate cyclase soluble subunit beta-1-like [Dermacentor silvarum]
MYGFVHCALEDMVRTKHGLDAWEKILRKSKIRMHGGSFLMHRVYQDDVTFKLVQSASEVLEMSPDACLEALGCHFLYFCQQHGYDHILRVLGSNLTDFLTNLDNLHDHLASTYPGMNAPSFRVSPGPMGSLHLHYCSERKGLHPIVKGLVKAVAREFFDTEVNVNTCKVTDRGDRVTVIMEVSECMLKLAPIEIPGLMQKRSSFTSAHITDHLSQSPQDLPVDTKTFCAAFPFHVIFDRDFVIHQAGKGLVRLTRSMWQRGKPVRFTDMFSICRPVIECSFESILGFLNQVYVVTAKDGVLERDRKFPQPKPASSPAGSRRKLLRRLNSTVEPPPDGVLRLKGQMVSLPEADCLLFLCSPRVKSLEDMHRVGLFFSDLALHDPVRDLILISHQRRRERELVEKLDEASNHLKILDSKLREDKRRTEDLLCSIFPARVARNLCLDLPVEAEKFEMVSCLFSDIVGFTALCGSENVQPMDIVRLLNRLYVQFDSLTNLHGVYKVETIGDAYLVVSGIPEFTDDHADRLVVMGLAMQAVTRTVQSPVEGHAIEIRIGIHSGPAMAGVVGTQMPRYCLFGHTVTLANKVESRGLPKQVTITEETKRHLKKDGYLFLATKPSPELQVRCYSVSRPGDAVAPDPATLGPALYGGGGHFRSPTGSPVHSDRNTGSRSSSTPSPGGSPLVTGGDVVRNPECPGQFTPPMKRKHRGHVFEFPAVATSRQDSTPDSGSDCKFLQSFDDAEQTREGTGHTSDDDPFDEPMCVINVESASSQELSLSSDTLSSQGASPCAERKSGSKSATGGKPPAVAETGSPPEEIQTDYQAHTTGSPTTEDRPDAGSQLDTISDMPRSERNDTVASSKEVKAPAPKRATTLKCCPFGSRNQDLNENLEDDEPRSASKFKPRCPFRLGGDEDDVERLRSPLVHKGSKGTRSGLSSLARFSFGDLRDPTSTCGVPTVVVKAAKEAHGFFPGLRSMLRKGDKKVRQSSTSSAPLSADSLAPESLAECGAEDRLGVDDAGNAASKGACPMRRMFSQVLTVNFGEAEGAEAAEPPGKRTQSCYSFRHLEDTELSAVEKDKQQVASGRFNLPQLNWHLPRLKQRITKGSLFSGAIFPSSR